MKLFFRWCRNLTPEAIAKGRERSAIARAKAAAEAYADLAPMMKDWRAEGMTLEGIAGKLNAEGHTTRKGKPWNPGCCSPCPGLVDCVAPPNIWRCNGPTWIGSAIGFAWQAQRRNT